jgi:glycine/D-amino acid oxidase-like deaminating enzyme
VVSAIVVGAGVFGVTAAIELRRRGRDVTLVDPGPIPHPLAESTDISKIVRLDYGADELYTELMERALERWRGWRFFHETGVLFLTRSTMQPGGFEHDSHALLSRRGHRLDRLDGAAIAARFPAWNAEAFVDGYFNPAGGFAESGNVVAWLAGRAKDAGVRVLPDTAIASLLEREDRVCGVVARDGSTLEADVVVLAIGSWTSHFVPSLAPYLFSTGQPVFHLAPARVERFDAARFPVFAADIARTGWYGFPAIGGVVKIANHGVGRAMHPESPSREVTDDERASLRTFLRDTFPSLADAPIAKTRVCVYGDTTDQHFLIAPDPERPGLVVAGGGSGHAFKFAPLLGEWIADAIEGNVLPRFRWRTDPAGAHGEERARHQLT